MIRLFSPMCIPFFLMLTLTLSGCTDSVEPNELAFVLGTAIDHTDNGAVEVSHQIVIPTQKNGPYKGGAGSSEGFVVLSATGRDVFEASQRVQKKVSRKLLTSHRLVIAISETYFNQNDARNLFDKLNRDPANNERDTIVMIKGSAKEFLMLGHPMEHLSSIAASKELQINGLRGFSMRQFMIDSVAEGTRPLIPALNMQTYKLSNKDSAQLANLSGYAVLNKKLKVQGVFADNEGSEAVWMAGKGTTQGFTIPWKDGKSQLSFRLTHLERRIHSGGGPEHIRLTVKAQAYLLENTTPLDMSDVNHLIEVQQYANTQMAKKLQMTMDKVKRRGTDVFGIGEYLHRKYPYWWKTQKYDWDDTFKTIDVSVAATISIRSIGTSAAGLNH